MTLLVVATPLPPDLAERLAGRYTLLETTPDALAAPPPALLERLRQARGLLASTNLAVDAALLARFPNLRVLSNYGVGVDNIDLLEAARRDVTVCNTPGVLDAAVADVATILILTLGRNSFANDRFVRDGQWQRGPAPYSHDLAGRRLGLLGMGRIGRLVAERARAFGLEVVYHNRSSRPVAESIARAVSRDELFAGSDFLSVHCPLTPLTRHSIGRREFAMMKPGAYFVNTARGAIVDEAALIEALRQGRIAGAGLDVMQDEPIGADHPLCGLPNVVLQPHYGSATHETRRAMIEMAVRNVMAGLEGTEPEAVVVPL